MTTRAAYQESVKLGARKVRERRASFGIVVGAVFVLFVLLASLPVDSPSANRLLGVLYVIVAGPAIIIGIVWWAQARCPRCGQQYYIRYGYGNLWTSNCLHCGLPLDLMDADIGRVQCAKCGYDIRESLDSHCCPECGSEIPEYIRALKNMWEEDEDVAHSPPACQVTEGTGKRNGSHDSEEANRTVT